MDGGVLIDNSFRTNSALSPVVTEECKLLPFCIWLVHLRPSEFPKPETMHYHPLGLQWCIPFKVIFMFLFYKLRASLVKWIIHVHASVSLSVFRK